MNTGNTGTYVPLNSQLRTPSGVYYCRAAAHACFYQPNQQPFHPWEVALTVVAAIVMVTTVVLLVRRLRAG
jgi:hypothetical protein